MKMLTPENMFALPAAPNGSPRARGLIGIFQLYFFFFHQYSSFISSFSTRHSQVATTSQGWWVPDARAEPDWASVCTEFQDEYISTLMKSDRWYTSNEGTCHA